MQVGDACIFVVTSQVSPAETVTVTIVEGSEVFIAAQVQEEADITLINGHQQSLHTATACTSIRGSSLLCHLHCLPSLSGGSPQIGVGALLGGHDLAWRRLFTLPNLEP